MSGDLQTRKRKDKKRRKDDEGSPFQPTIPLITNNHSSNDDVTIHVHKEGGLGGGICAKLVFFVLFSALAVLIGLIITEHRGLTDVDVVDTNSKFSQMFEGWTDSSVDHHEDELAEIEDVLSEEQDHHDEEDEPDADNSEPENEEEHEHYDDEETDRDEDQDNEEEVEEENVENDDDEERSIDEDEEQSIDEDDDSGENEDNVQLSQEQTSGEDDKDVEETEETYESNEVDEDVKESEENEVDGDEDTEQNYSTEKTTDDKSEEQEQISAENEDEDDDEINNEEDELEENDEEVDNDENFDDRDKNDEIEKDESAEENASEEKEEIDKSNEDENNLEENLSEEKQRDIDTDDDDERFVRKASYEISKEQEKDVDDEETKEILKDNDDQNEDEHPELISPKREPDDNVQESSGSPSKILSEVGGTASGVTKNETNSEQALNQQIDDANEAIKYNPAYAVKLFDKILEMSPSSPRSIYGKALALNHLADQKRSNEILYRAIQLYTKLLKMPDVPDALYKETVDRTIKVMRFVGQYKNIIEIHKLAISRFREDSKYYNELAVTYLTINRIEEARPVLKQVLKKWPNDGVALVHQGFILKTTDNKLEEAVDYLKRGIATNHAGVIDGRFYFHLGDALERLGRHDEAMQVYEDGTKNKVFLSKYQRSLYNVKRLTGKPFWEEYDLPYSDLFRELKQHWRKIRDEGLSILNEKGYFQDESENLRDTGEWKQFELFARGQKNMRNCAKSPVTCSLIEKIPEARGCKRGQTKFSVMHPGTHVWPHCGPTNCRLRVHLGLKVPPKTFLRVADEMRSWKEGKIIIFDDSFEHEVWHNGTEFRLVLIVDVWHPELSSSEKRNLSPI